MLYRQTLKVVTLCVKKWTDPTSDCFERSGGCPREKWPYDERCGTLIDSASLNHL